MQVSDKLIKPLTEAKYLNADNVSRYRCIMRIFFEHYEKLKYWLYQEEVYEEMIKDPFFADYRPEKCQQDLTMLTEWKNLNTIQDTKKVASIEEFKNKKYRYQMTEYSVEIERLVLRLENLFIEGASLEPTLLERIRRDIERFPEMVERDKNEVYTWWTDLNNDFVRLNQNYQDYIRDLNSVRAEEMMHTKQFLVFKDRLIEYLRSFIKGLQRNVGVIEESLCMQKEEMKNQVFEKVVDYELSIPRMDVEVSKEMIWQKVKGRYQSIYDWFVGNEGQENEAGKLFDATNDIIRKITSLMYLRERKEHLEDLDADMEQIRYDLQEIQKEIRRKTEEQTSIQEQLRLTDYEEIKERLDACINWLQDYPEQLRVCVSRQTHEEDEVGQLTLRLDENKKKIEEYEKKTKYFSECYDMEKALHYVEIPKEIPEDAAHIRSYLESDVKALDKDSVIRDLNKVYFENRGFLTDYHLMQNELFTEEEQTEFPAKRLDISARYQGVKISFASLLLHLEEDITELENLIKDGDRELFEDILANTVSRKIRGKINGSNTWVQKMNSLMNGMNTSSGLKLSLRWRSKTAEQEDQLDTKELVELLKKDYRLMSEDEAARLSAHFRSKVAEARRNAKDSAGMISFYQIMKDTLDYRKWFEFQLFSQKNGERQKELTNSVFGTFSGGEKAMSMYVPLFSAVVAKYQGGREDAPRLISLDEAFAGVDNKNIRDMFRLMTEFRFDFIINSQVLWGDCDTLDALAIYQLIRPGNAKFVTVMPYLWNGHRKELLEHEEEVEQRGIELGQAEGI